MPDGHAVLYRQTVEDSLVAKATTKLIAEVIAG